MHADLPADDRAGIGLPYQPGCESVRRIGLQARANGRMPGVACQEPPVHADVMAVGGGMDDVGWETVIRQHRRFQAEREAMSMVWGGGDAAGKKRPIGRISWADRSTAMPPEPPITALNRSNRATGWSATPRVPGWLAGSAIAPGPRSKPRDNPVMIVGSWLPHA